MKTLKTAMSKPAVFYINPEDPNVDTMTPINYMQCGRGWQRRFVNKVKAAKIVSGRYFVLAKDGKTRTFYDVLTHNVYVLHPDPTTKLT